MPDKLLSILLTAFLGAVLTLLSWMSNSLYDISKSLAVVVYQIQDHDQRIVSLETWRQDQSGSAPARRR